MRRLGVFLLAVLTGTLLGQELALSLPVLGVGPDVVLLVAVAFATGERPGVAAGYGFLAGFLRDLQLSAPRGTSAFAYALTAYGVGLLGEVRGVWAMLGLVTGATFVGQTAWGLLVALLSQSAPVGALPRVVLGTTAYNAVLAPFLVPLLRRFARPQEGVRAGQGGGAG